MKLNTELLAMYIVLKETYSTQLEEVLFKAPRLSLPPRPHLSLMGAACTCQTTQPTQPELQARHKDTCWNQIIYMLKASPPHTHPLHPHASVTRATHYYTHFTARRYFCKAVIILGYIKSLPLTHRRGQVISTEHGILSHNNTQKCK